MDKKEKKALLVVSFGTSYRENAGKTIGAIEQRLREAFPERDFYRSYTSRMIVDRIKKRDGETIELPMQALERLKEEGYTDVLIQPTHIIAGREYLKTLEEADRFRDDFPEYHIGAPLLNRPEDYSRIAKDLSERFPKKEGRGILLMGHGTDHPSNACYPALNYQLRLLGRTDLQLACVEGYPDPQTVIASFDPSIDTLLLAPFMIVAGEHVNKDLCGGEDSWQSQLRKKGYQIETQTQGLGEFPSIHDCFVDHARDAVTVEEAMRKL